MLEGIFGIARAFLGAGARPGGPVGDWRQGHPGVHEEFLLTLGKRDQRQWIIEQSHETYERIFNEVKHWAPFVLIADDVTLEFGGN